MAIGYEFKDVCYASQNAAQDAFFSSYPPMITNTETIQYILQGGVWMISKTTWDSLGNATANYLVAPALVPQFRTCDNPNDATERFLDGMTLGWGVATAMIVVYLIRRLHR